MTYPLVRFVESPAPDAAIRYDFNSETASAPRQVRLGGLSLGYPTLQGEPDAVGAAYGFRRPRIGQRVYGAKADALLTLSALSRELLRQTNWLMVQWSATTPPVWLRTYRSAEAELTLDQVYVDTETGDPVTDVGDVWEIDVPLVADPFGYGARETLAPVTIVQAPSGTNPMRYVLPAIKGDAPTPLRVTITPTSGSGSGNSPGTASWLIGCINSTDTVSDPVVDIGTGDGFIAGTGTGAPAADAAYFDGEYRQVTIAAATPNLVNRLSGTFPVVPIGRYKVLLRCTYTAGAAKTLLFRFNLWPGGGSTYPISGGTTSVEQLATDTGRAFWVDLGEFNLPTGVFAPSDGGLTVGSSTIGLDIGTADGSASSVRIDAFKLIPVGDGTVEGATLLRTFGPTPVPLQYLTPGTFDGDLELAWFEEASSGEYAPLTSAALHGEFPVADPAAQENLLIVMALDPGMGTTSGPTRITGLNTEAEVTVSYQPLYLHLGDGT